VAGGLAVSDTGAGKKITVLGGGASALAAAFEIRTAWPEAQIDVYTLGWRLGGKGASGRNMNPGMGYRIEEHGLHMWSGLYDNAFDVMRRVYETVDRPPDAVNATVWDAFSPASNVVLVEQFRGRFIDWNFVLPQNPQRPGAAGQPLFLPLWEYVWMAFQLLSELLVSRVDRAVTFAGAVVSLRALSGARKSHRHFRRLAKIAVDVLTPVMRHEWTRIAANIDDDQLREEWCTINFLFGNLRGCVAGDVLKRGLDYLDDEDYRMWLSRFVIDDRVDGRPLTLNSPWAFWMYDAEFAYVDGRQDLPNIGAGITLKTFLRMAFTYRGAALYRMNGGMGDVVFAPLYQALRKLGVNVHLFHRVEALELGGDDGRSVARIRLTVQARGKDGVYDPLIEVNGLPCWPAEPLWDRLEDGEKMRAEHVNLEALRGPGVGEAVLELGRDFDSVVLGIPVGALPYCCGELIRRDPAWKDMVDHVKTVPTQSLQLWFNRTSSQLGWTGLHWPVLSTYDVTPLDTWADMTHLLPREAWPPLGEQYPRSIAYFCGPMLDIDPPHPSPDGPVQGPLGTDEAAGKLRTRAVARTLCEQHLGPIFPAAVDPPNTGSLDWQRLIDDRPEPAHGEARLDVQWIRANVSPSERFTLSVARSWRYRLAPGASRFTNLVLCGDWTDTTFNIGNIECTVMSGRLASNALTGSPPTSAITGWGFGSGEDG
jgi:uncharacterized protein with NAD-binding domain and iron-sulfur cluster